MNVKIKFSYNEVKWGSANGWILPNGGVGSVEGCVTSGASVSICPELILPTLYDNTHLKRLLLQETTGLQETTYTCFRYLTYFSF